MLESNEQMSGHLGKIKNVPWRAEKSGLEDSRASRNLFINAYGRSLFVNLEAVSSKRWHVVDAWLPSPILSVATLFDDKQTQFWASVLTIPLLVLAWLIANRPIWKSFQKSCPGPFCVDDFETKIIYNTFFKPHFLKNWLKKHNDGLCRP